MRLLRRIAARVRQVKGFQGGRFYLNEWREMFAPRGEDDRTAYYYVGHLDIDEPWFPKSTLTGTITPLGDSVRLAAKALDANTAKIICASTTDIPKTKAIDELLAKSANEPGSGGAAEPQGRSPAGRPSYEAESYRATIESVRRVGPSIAVTVMF